MISPDTIQTWSETGISLVIIGQDRLRVTRPPDQMTKNLQSKIVKNKNTILRLLSPNSTCEYQDWTDADLTELWQERSAIMEYDGGLSANTAEEVSKQWIIGQIGERRFHRIASNARFATEATKCVVEKNGPCNSNVASDATNGTTKWLPGARTPDSLSTQLSRS